MKRVIDIEDEMLQELYNNKYLPTNIKDILQFAMPLEDVKKIHIAQGFHDGYNQATDQANAVIDDLISEINRIYEQEKDIDFKWATGLKHSIQIIKEYTKREDK